MPDKNYDDDDEEVVFRNIKIYVSAVQESLLIVGRISVTGWLHLQK